MDRVTKDNRTFKMYKFRSMRVDKNANEKSLRPDQDRIFPFGRFMRATKIDELPQLLNVFLGDMAVVGERGIIETTKKNADFSRVVTVNSISL